MVKQASVLKLTEKMRDLFVVLLLAYFIPRVAYIAATRWAGVFSGLDPDHVFVWNYIHHIVQMVLALGIIFYSFVYNKNIHPYHRSPLFQHPRIF